MSKCTETIFLSKTDVNSHVAEELSKSKLIAVEEAMFMCPHCHNPECQVKVPFNRTSSQYRVS